MIILILCVLLHARSNFYSIQFWSMDFNSKLLFDSFSSRNYSSVFSSISNTVWLLHLQPLGAQLISLIVSFFFLSCKKHSTNISRHLIRFHLVLSLYLLVGILGNHSPMFSLPCSPMFDCIHEKRQQTICELHFLALSGVFSHSRCRCHLNCSFFCHFTYSCYILFSFCINICIHWYLFNLIYHRYTYLYIKYIIIKFYVSFWLHQTWKKRIAIDHTYHHL